MLGLAPQAEKKQGENLQLTPMMCSPSRAGAGQQLQRADGCSGPAAAAGGADHLAFCSRGHRTGGPRTMEGQSAAAIGMRSSECRQTCSDQSLAVSAAAAAICPGVAHCRSSPPLQSKSSRTTMPARCPALVLRQSCSSAPQLHSTEFRVKASHRACRQRQRKRQSLARMRLRRWRRQLRRPTR